ncbi:MAG: hypothetical protein ABIH59_02055 [archaeon]
MTKMNTKNVMVSIFAIVTALFLLNVVAASDLADKVLVKVDGTYVGEFDGEYCGTEGYDDCDVIEVDAGETISIVVRFTALEYDSDVTIDAELEGDKVDVDSVSDSFDVEPGNRYRKTLTIKVPYELKDDLSDDLELNIEIDGDDYKTELETIILRVQRPSYNADIKSITTSQTVKAGETFPVDIVLKNVGYNDLDDVYVTAKIPTLGIQQSTYFGDIVALECDDDFGDDDLPWGENTLGRSCDEDDEDSARGKLSLKIPYGVQSGVYTLEVQVSNDDTTSTKTVQIVVDNDFESTVFKSGNSIWVVNPTDTVAGYRIIAESPASVSESIVFVPAGASKTIAVNANTEGEYTFDVNVFTLKGELVDTMTFSGNAVLSGSDDDTETNPIVILTVILAIIFIVLLIVLIVLIGKKPEKSGEFGESYY